MHAPTSKCLFFIVSSYQLPEYNVGRPIKTVVNIALRLGHGFEFKSIRLSHRTKATQLSLKPVNDYSTDFIESNTELRSS